MSKYDIATLAATDAPPGVDGLKSLFSFWKELLRSPRSVGAVLPSAKSLGIAVTDEVLRRPPGFVIELGAGTGVITQALVDIRDRLTGLIVIEKSERLVEVLNRSYPMLNIQAGCASFLGDMRFPESEPVTVVSSLPLRSLAESDLSAIKEAIAVLGARHAEFRFIQYSYFGRLPFTSHVPWLMWERKKTVSTNIPPATIWVLGKVNPAK